MENKEQSQNSGGQNIVEILALVLAQKIKREELGGDNQAVLDYYLGLMADDAKFAAQVNSRKNQLLTDGRKIPLYPPEVIDRMTKRKKHKKGRNESTQPSLWPEEPKVNKETVRLEFTADPEQKMDQLGNDLNFPFYRHRQDSPIVEEITAKRAKLRSRIGLPVARGKDPHVNDDFYKFLVSRVCTYDRFRIFNEYDRVLGKVPPELERKINQVAGMVDELLSQGPNNRKLRFHQMEEDYRKRWNMPK